MKCFTMFFLIAIFAATGFFGTAACGMDGRMVTVSVTVRSAAGTAIAGLPVICGRRDGGIVGAVTDAAGACSIPISIPNGATTLYASIAQGFDELPRIQTDAAIIKYKETIAASHFNQWYLVSVADGATGAACEIRGTAPIAVTAHSPQDASGRRKLFVGCHHSAPMVLYRDNGKPDVVVSGLERGKAALICISGNIKPSQKVIELSAAETLEDRDIGDVVVPNFEGTESCTITVTDRDQLVKRPDIGIQSVTIISEDHAQVLVYRIDGRSQVVSEDGKVPKLAPGRYAVVPGMIGGDPGPAAVYGEMKRTNAIPSNIPAITVTAGGANTFSIASVPGRDASIALPAYP